MIKDMETIRAEVTERIVAKLKLRDTLKEASEQLAAHADVDSLLNVGRQNIKGDVNHLMGHIALLQYVVEDDIWPDIQQFAMLFARDVIAETVRQAGGLEPIVTLTGNSMAPAFRCFDQIEAIWQADEEGTYIMEMWERIENKVGDFDIYLDSPEDDNSLYGVDLRRWERSEAAEKDMPMDDMNEEWSAIDPEPGGEYVLKAETLDTAVEVVAGVAVQFKLNQSVKFRQPNGDTDTHTIAAIGRDSDNDVWVLLEGFGVKDVMFDWATILVPEYGWDAEGMAAELEAAGWPAVAGDARDGLHPETILRRLREIDLGDSIATEIVAKYT